MPRIPPSQQRRILREAQKVARTVRPRISGILKRLGPIGGLIHALADAIAGGRSGDPSAHDIEQATKILREQGFEVRRPGEPEAPPVQQPGRVGRVPTPPPVATPSPGRRPPAEVFPAETTIQTLPTRIRGAMESIGDDIEGFSAWVLTPQSSNVFGVAYDYEQGILYVQFKAEGKPIGYKQGISLCSGKEYKIGIRQDAPGPIYSYGGAGRKVPVEIFNAIATGRSPGKQVWDKLRVCGSQWQHKFPYTLTDVPTGQSVPRKATRRGLRVRNVATVGMGRRGSRISTLPESVGRIRR